MGQVVFSHCTFKKTLNLSGATFRKQVLFRHTIFEGKFYPRSTKFHDIVNFRWTQFCNADFHDTLFKDKANFHSSEFSGRTRFLDTKFEGKANFVKTMFHGETKFIGTVFKEAFFSPNVTFEGETKFSRVAFENGERIHFEVEDLSNVSFLNTDISRVTFGNNVQWGKEGNDFEICDERLLTKPAEKMQPNTNEFAITDELKHPSQVRLGDVIAAYRNLRKNYDFRLKFEIADEFFRREMELRRINNERSGRNAYVVNRNNWFGRNLSLTGLYFHISKYGQDYIRPVLLAILFVSLPVAYELAREWNSGNRMDLATILNIATANLSKIFNIGNQDVVSFLIGAITIPILVGLVVAAFKRPFEKKFRY